MRLELHEEIKSYHVLRDKLDHLRQNNRDLRDSFVRLIGRTKTEQLELGNKTIAESIAEELGKYSTVSHRIIEDSVQADNGVGRMFTLGPDFDGKIHNIIDS
jgi:hypothetical protein